MSSDSARPVVVWISNAIVYSVAWLVPAEQRSAWKHERIAGVWHRWQFLHYSGEWSAIERFRILLYAFGAVPDAFWHFSAQEDVRRHVKAIARSPWSCFAVLAFALIALAYITNGLPATSQLLSKLLDSSGSRLVVVWLQPFGGKPHGIPPDVIPDWRKDSHALESVASFSVKELPVKAAAQPVVTLPVISTESHLFEVLKVRPTLGSVSGSTFTAIDHRIWTTNFHRDANIAGKTIWVAGKPHIISAVLPNGFEFLTRQPSVYISEEHVRGDRVMVLGRVRKIADIAKLNRELAQIARQADYYFFVFDPQLRSTTLSGVLFSPVRLFGLAVAISLFPIFWFSRVRLRLIRLAWAPANRLATLNRSAFFLAKLALALTLVFVAGLEWARPESSILLTWTDAGSGLGIIWLYSLGAMAALFGAVADQRARCRVCLRLLAFPVRIGRPGSLLLDWGGTEFLCSEGHGVLHIPHLSTSWDEEADRWIKLDDSWR